MSAFSSAMLAVWARSSQRSLVWVESLARGFAADAQERCQGVTTFEKPGILSRSAPLIAHETFFDFVIRDESAARNALKRWCR